jgi:MSHA biogenesis protein MshL
MNQALDESVPAAKSNEPPAEVSAALLPPININVTGADEADTEPRFDVRVRNVAARDFFMSLVDGTPYNIVVPAGLVGSITLDLKNVTVPEVMEIVRRTYGHEYDRTVRGFEVLPERLTTRIYYVDYLDVKRAGRSSMSAAPGEVTMTRSGGTGSDSGQDTRPTSTATQGSYSRINTDSSADLWTGLGDSLRQLIGAGEGRTITVNSQSGVIVARAMPAELRAVGDFLSAMQGMVQRQVILEARILEVELADAFQSGINWAAIGKQNGTNLTGGQFGSGTVLNTGASNVNGANLFGAGSSATAFNGLKTDVGSGFGGVFALAVEAADFIGFIELLKTQGEVQVLSSPRVSTVNNQKAVIKVGSDEFFVTGVDSNTTTGTATSQQVNVELTPFFSGVALDVTPQISRDGDIVLHVHPSVSEVMEQTKNITALNQTFTLPTAASTIRESDSVVRARNAQIVVIGGLMQTREQDEEAGVPFLSDIPVLGNLFKHTRKSKRKSELVILLKPVIVDSAEVWNDQVQRSSPTIRKMGRD